MKRVNYKSKSNINFSGILKSIIALTTSAVLIAAGTCCLGFASRSAEGKWFGNFKNIASWHWQDEAPSEGKEEGNGSTEESIDFVSDGENKGIRLKSKRLARSEFEDYGISAQALYGCLITATINEDAEDKRVIKSIYWKDEGSAWVKETNANLSDYADICNDEGEFTYSVGISQAFGEPIIFKVESAMDSNVYGTVQIDFLKELEGFTAVLNPTISSGDVGRIYVGETMNTVNIVPQYGVGTLTGTISNYRTTFITNKFFREKFKDRLDECPGTGAFTPKTEFTCTGLEFTIPLLTLVTGNGDAISARTNINNFIKEYGATESFYNGDSSANAGVLSVRYDITYSYGDYSVEKSRTYYNLTDDRNTEEYRSVYAFRNDNLTKISTITSIQLSPDAIVIYPQTPQE